jgi:pyruvate,water dikinase
MMTDNDLKESDNGLEVFIMAKILSNVIFAEKFVEIFDGFSLGSNDLTQLTLGIDRNSELIGKPLFETDESAKQMIKMIIQSASKTKTKIGLCGQTQSDFPKFVAFL